VGGEKNTLNTKIVGEEIPVAAAVAVKHLPCMAVLLQ
jgi:hypothetical protein